MNDTEAMRDSSYRTRTCFFKDESDHLIFFEKFILSLQNEDCNRAILRIYPRIHLDAVKKFIDSIPEVWNGLNVMSAIQKKYFYSSFELRVKEVLEPAYHAIMQYHHF